MIKYILAYFLSVGLAYGQTVKMVTEDFPPFQTLNNGNMQGPMYSIMRSICLEANLQCRFEMLPWKDAYRKAVSGEADVVFSILLEVPERREFFYLSPSIVNTSYSFFVTSRSKWVYSGLQSLDGMIVGAYGPSGTSIVAQEVVTSRAVQGFEPTTLIIEPSIVDSFQQLIIGKYGVNGAIVVNKDVGIALLKKHSIFGPKVAGDIKQITYGFGVSKKASRSDLYPRLVDALRRLQLRGEILDTLRFYGLKASP